MVITQKCVHRIRATPFEILYRHTNAYTVDYNIHLLICLRIQLRVFFSMDCSQPKDNRRAVGSRLCPLRVDDVHKLRLERRAADEEPVDVRLTA